MGSKRFQILLCIERHEEICALDFGKLNEGKNVLYALRCTFHSMRTEIDPSLLHSKERK